MKSVLALAVIAAVLATAVALPIATMKARLNRTPPAAELIESDAAALQRAHAQAAADATAEAAAEAAMHTALEAHAEQQVAQWRATMSAEQFAAQMALIRSEMTAIEATIARVGDGGKAASQKLLSKNGALCKYVATQAMVFLKDHVNGARTWWTHSGTASFLYGFRNGASADKEAKAAHRLISDVDIHVHPLFSAGKAVGNAKEHTGWKNTAGATLNCEVDAYDPCVDRGQAWAVAVETAVRAGSVVNCGDAESAVNPDAKTAYVVTLNQLLFEYTFIVRANGPKPNDLATQTAATNAGAGVGATVAVVAPLTAA